MDTNLLREVLARWASGVVVVATMTDSGRRHGMTASSFSAVALDPPLISICLTTTSTTQRLIEQSDIFTVSILGHDHEPIGRRFAGMDKSGTTDRFGQERWDTAQTGAPVLADAVGWLDCRVAARHEAGDHTIILGTVQAAATPRSAEPLIYHARTFCKLRNAMMQGVIQ
ncbi:flavin reductase family protein [Microtetraspora sp. AC03309]|uniref:flavin reductase family protein n=1 Tax=Microtetraspora sp. AC03309 TaxID=2779376 RepID=UPI000773AA2A|nr:flavin reductase family protein [Microtetraspora sp. AC03309]MCC5578376.1 flavin reductase family protein [Microtetraspora sp. AC03309]